MEVSGWRLFQHPLFETQLTELAKAVEKLSIQAPKTYSEHPKAKLLATIRRYINDVIPRNPGAAEFRQGDALGPDNRHWFRAKFHQRYRLFFRFSTKDRIIVYVWVNDERTLRKASSKTDPYAVFRSMLRAGDPPQALESLLKRCKEIQGTPIAKKGDSVRP
jgi:toxin YhaV